MMNRTPPRYLTIAVVLWLGLALHGCSSDLMSVLTLDELIGRLDIDLAAEGGNGIASSNLSGDDPFWSPGTKLTEPELSEIKVASPGTPQVFSWPEVRDLPIEPRFSGHDIILKWPYVNWPAFDVLDPQYRYFGNSGFVYRSGGKWHAVSTEWLRDENNANNRSERTGTYYPYEEKFVSGSHTKGTPVAFFIAGPWRLQGNQNKYQRRSKLQWYTWPGLEPFVWPGSEDDPPAPEGIIEEIHVYITGITTQFSGGTALNFNKEIGDVDLLALRDKRVDAVDSDVATGTYEYVEFTIDPDRSFLVIDGEDVPLGVPSENIRVNGPFTVGPDLPTSVTIEVDPDSSLTENADGSYTLNLVVVLKVTTS